jgi:hypothetical protein
MTTYRCYFFCRTDSTSGASQMVEGMRDIETTTDDEACIQAEVVCRRGGAGIQGFEVWQRDRLVFRHRRAPDDYPSPSLPAPGRIANQDRAA